jgi:hypothetical protein
LLGNRSADLRFGSVGGAAGEAAHNAGAFLANFFALQKSAFSQTAAANSSIKLKNQRKLAP